MLDFEDEDEDELVDDEPVDAPVDDSLLPALGAVEDDEEAAAVADTSSSEEPLHDPLFPPGRILYLNRVAVPDSEPNEVRLSCRPDWCLVSGTDAVGCRRSGVGCRLSWQPQTRTSSPVEEVELVEVGNDEFSRVVLSNKMILDHLCTAYERMLQSTRILPPAADERTQATSK